MEKYFIMRDGGRVGPLSADGLAAELIDATTPVWHQGMPAWAAASQLPELRPLLATLPPPPQAASAARSGGRAARPLMVVAAPPARVPLPPRRTGNLVKGGRAVAATARVLVALVAAAIGVAVGVARLSRTGQGVAETVRQAEEAKRREAAKDGSALTRPASVPPEPPPDR